MPSIKFPVSDVGGAIGFGIFVVVTIAVAKRLPLVKTLL